MDSMGRTDCIQNKHNSIICFLCPFSVDLPGSGSDHAPFRDQLGVPIVDMWFTYDPVSLNCNLIYGMSSKIYI